MLRFPMYENTVAHCAMIFKGRAQLAVSLSRCLDEAVPGATAAAFVLPASEARRSLWNCSDITRQQRSLS